MNNELKEFMDKASPKELLEAYFDAKTRQSGSLSSLSGDLVSRCISNISEALDILPVYGRDNTTVTREEYLEAREKLKQSGFKF